MRLLAENSELWIHVAQRPSERSSVGAEILKSSVRMELPVAMAVVLITASTMAVRTHALARVKVRESVSVVDRDVHFDIRHVAKNLCLGHCRSLLHGSMRLDTMAHD